MDFPLRPPSDAPLTITPVSAFNDNYVWLLERGGDAVVVDPGDAAPVERALNERGLTLRAILLTHHHADHTGGVRALLDARAGTTSAPLRVYGPASESIEGVTDRLADSRGSFARFYCERDLAPAVGNRRIVQINHSRTTAAGAVRGLHFQYAPFGEMKIIRCLQGSVFDVAVDLRRGSSTFLGWHGEILSPGNGRAMVIPEGFAHGFQALEPDCELLYLHSAMYTAAAEGGVSPLDPCLDIRWPLSIGEMSTRDRNHPFLTDDFKGL